MKPTLLAFAAALTLATALHFATSTALSAQQTEWRHWGIDAASTRYSPLGQIDASNFNDLEVAWIWRSDNFGPEPEPFLRATPIYVDGILYSVAGSRRTAVAIDPATGETIWTYREPHTRRWEESMRKNYGKGVAYAEVNGRKTIYLVTPGLFLHALDPMTGTPIESFGKKGKVDLLGDLGHSEHYPEDRLPPDVAHITNSSPPIVVNGVVVVGNSREQGSYQTMAENVPGIILAYDADTGEHLWNFNMIPREGGEFDNDTWKRNGNVSALVPLSADAELGLVYMVTGSPAVDYDGSFHTGDNVMATSILALDVRTGERRWHFQTVHRDVWNHDNPTAPNLVDVNVNGRAIKALVQTTRQGRVYILDRETGEPVWPIKRRPVPQSTVPGERRSPTQPSVTRPAPHEMQRITEDDIIDFTPELRTMAMEVLEDFKLGPLFNPSSTEGHPDNVAIRCPGANRGTDIPSGATVDPENGVLYLASTRGCSAPGLVPGTDEDPDSNVEWVSVGPGDVRGPHGLPIVKPPYSTITAIDLKTGDHLWRIPNGQTPEWIRNHPLLQGIEVGNTGARSHATKLVTSTLLMYGEGRGAAPVFRAVDKMTGEELGRMDLPGSTLTAPMSYMHDGVQYVVMAVNGPGLPGSLVALRLSDGQVDEDSQGDIAQVDPGTAESQVPPEGASAQDQADDVNEVPESGGATAAGAWFSRSLQKLKDLPASIRQSLRNRRGNFSAEELYARIPNAVKLKAEDISEFLSRRDVSHIESVKNAPELESEVANIVFEESGSNRARGGNTMTTSELWRTQLDNFAEGIKKGAGATAAAASKAGFLAALLELPVTTVENLKLVHAEAQTADEALRQIVQDLGTQVIIAGGTAAVLTGVAVLGLPGQTLVVPIAVVGGVLYAYSAAERLAEAWTPVMVQTP